MITSFILRAIVIKGVSTLSFSGFITRGIVYDILKSISPNLAEEIHRMKKISPLSTSPLTVEPNSKTINVGSIITFRISILSEELAIKIRDYLLENVDLTLKIGNTEAKLTNLSVIVLDPKRILEEAKPLRSFSISFLSPTFLRQSLTKKCCQYCPNLKIKCPHLKQYRYYRYIPLPDPYLIFRNLLRLWRKYTGISLNHKEYIDWLLKGGIAVAGYRKLKTVRVYEHPTTPKWSVGFIGEVMFNLPEDTYDEEMAKTTHTLLKFGEHSNIGGNRTAGFGVIRYQQKQNNKS
ncbi:MAG: CRISPR system precrRNA processing endoribonuclease RAMP protein Cas6 [Candidatus Methanomethylicia archaeon]